MASAPTKEEVKKLTEQSEKAEAKKLASQQKQDKDFVNSGHGVIPEASWKNLPGKVE